MVKLEIELTGMIIDTGYGEADCDVQADVTVNEATLEVNVVDGMIFIYDHDGGIRAEWGLEDHFETAIREAALEKYKKLKKG